MTDVRIGGTGVKNIRMFKKLCGDDRLGSVVLATKFRSVFSDVQQVNDREAQYIREAYLWKPLID